MPNFNFGAVVAQDYATHVNPEYVIVGNSAVVKCGVPSFVADFVWIASWLEETSGQNYYHSPQYGIQSLPRALGETASSKKRDFFL